MTVLLSVALLLPAGSFTPAGAAIVAVFEIVPLPVTVAVTVNVAVPPLPVAVAVTRNVAVPPFNRSMLTFRLPLPDAGHAEPGDAAQVHAAPVSCAGSTSAMIAPVTDPGPALLATIA